MDMKRFKDIERKYINELDDSIDTLQGDDYLKVEDIGWLIDHFKQQQEQIDKYQSRCADYEKKLNRYEKAYNQLSSYEQWKMDDVLEDPK